MRRQERGVLHVEREADGSPAVAARHVLSEDLAPRAQSRISYAQDNSSEPVSRERVGQKRQGRRPGSHVRLVEKGLRHGAFRG